VRVLFSSTWGYGHLFPMMPLARAFIGDGHDVLWATSADSCRHVAEAGIDTASAGLAGRELLEAVAALVVASGSLAPEKRAAFLFPHMFGATFTPPMVADLLPLARLWRPDLLIHEHGELASPLVGAVLGLPSVTHAFGAAIPESFVEEAGQRLAPLWAAHGLSVPPYAGCFTSLYLDICPSAVQSVPLTHIDARQPLRPVPAGGGSPARLPDYLAEDTRPLVYLTLGTVHNHAPFLRPIVEALSDLPVRLLVTVGPDGDPATLGNQPSNVRVERWVPQAQLLQHCALVASHAGSGTFLGALSHGLPQLCLPQAADQFRNAEGGTRAGAVLVLTPTQTSPTNVVEAVQRLIAEHGFRRNAARVAADIRAMPSPQEVARELLRRF
jgi:UDP:flavonoid glycosyltransferase YjiC (YdhE family)